MFRTPLFACVTTFENSEKYRKEKENVFELLAKLTFVGCVIILFIFFFTTKRKLLTFKV